MRNEQDTQLMIALLEETRGQKNLLLERQAEALALQRKKYALVQKQHERAERIQIVPSPSRT